MVQNVKFVGDWDTGLFQVDVATTPAGKTIFWGGGGKRVSVQDLTSPDRFTFPPQTKEVRALALSILDLHPGHVFWDIGAGSGSVAIEAARLVEPGMVYAIEKEAPDYHLILANAETFGVKKSR